MLKHRRPHLRPFFVKNTFLIKVTFLDAKTLISSPNNAYRVIIVIKIDIGGLSRKFYSFALTFKIIKKFLLKMNPFALNDFFCFFFS